jgi:hypothetical protein
MLEPQISQFDTHTEFSALIRQCLARASCRIQLFDPDFSRWPLSSVDVIDTLRHFLRSGTPGRLQLAMHHAAHLEQHCPRFVALLTEYSHAIECRVTPKYLRLLTDSFCVSDDINTVRRFHANHFRGEAAFDSTAGGVNCVERFSAIWDESRPILHSTRLTI